LQILSAVGGIYYMTEYRFEIIKVEPLKGQKLAGSKDYTTHVLVIRDGKTLLDENIKVRTLLILTTLPFPKPYIGWLK
jgi:hypothetical protein